MREKELRVALVCYGGISLAVTMHGVTKEIWHATRASRAWHAGDALPDGVAGVYARLFDTIGRTSDLALRFIPDILSGTSAGGINAVFLAQALLSGQSLDALTGLWLDGADSDVLIAPEARPWSRMAKIWAWPIVWLALRLPGTGLDDAALAPQTRAEVRAKVSRLIRARWFQPPFSGIGFSRLLADALAAMARSVEQGDHAPLLPIGHPLDLAITATDLGGHRAVLALHSPPLVHESEHRLTIGFHAQAAADHPPLAPMAELVMAARATASFPGAFPPLQVGEIDALLVERGWQWPGRDAFLKRIMPVHWRAGTHHTVALIDGAVLNNRPFAQAMAALRNRPARREVDRRFVYIEPHPAGDGGQHSPAQGFKAPGFFATIFAALLAIPREQPIRDNLTVINRQSQTRERLRALVEAQRPDIEAKVAQLFGHTLFFESPSPARLTAWRAKAQAAAAETASFAYHGYAQVKRDTIVADLAATIAEAVPDVGPADRIVPVLTRHLDAHDLNRLVTARGDATAAAIGFFRTHDIAYRIRRLKLLARRLTEDRAQPGTTRAVTRSGREAARTIVYQAQALYQARETARGLGPAFAAAAALVHSDPGAVLATIAAARDLAAIDVTVDAMMVDALGKLDRPLRRAFLNAYLGFAWYDIATLPLMRGDGEDIGAPGEFDAIKVDRISPEDARSIRSGGTLACLKGTAFFSFGAFFSRAFRENDYLWGRLHGAERMIDIIASSVEPPLPDATLRTLKRDAFLAILDEEAPNLRADPGLVPGIRHEVEAAFANDGTTKLSHSREGGNGLT
ncbi:patatin-like protein [Novosphingobium sp.]|uniref:patatin-like protein n=1 Tax=Novosphingobium sp. TaxID=1874826 RepID=UPI003341B893